MGRKKRNLLLPLEEIKICNCIIEKEKLEELTAELFIKENKSASEIARILSEKTKKNIYPFYVLRHLKNLKIFDIKKIEILESLREIYEKSYQTIIKKVEEGQISIPTFIQLGGIILQELRKEEKNLVNISQVLELIKQIFMFFGSIINQIENEQIKNELLEKLENFYNIELPKKIKEIIQNQL